jgi:hypothetical protein
MIKEKWLHHVPVFGVPRNRLGKEVGHLLHHRYQASAAWSRHDLVSDDDHHAKIGELADRWQQDRSGTPGKDCGPSGHGDRQSSPRHRNPGSAEVPVSQQTDHTSALDCRNERGEHARVTMREHLEPETFAKGHKFTEFPIWQLFSDGGDRHSGDASPCACQIQFPLCGKATTAPRPA